MEVFDQIDKVAPEVRKMLLFIEQEAKERAWEIKIKTDEEFEIQKARVLREELLIIEQQFNQNLLEEEVKFSM